jgi:hypothetical protein
MDSRTIKRFRLKIMKGPIHRGVLNQFHDYLFEIELDPSSPYNTEKSKVLVTLFDTAYFSLAPGDPEVSPFLEEGRVRIAYYVITTLQSQLPYSALDFPLHLNPTVEEINELQKIDPSRVDIDEWQEVPAKGVPDVRQVFISCGQQSDEEIALGNAIVRYVKERTGIDGYFAEYQYSLDGLTRNIFNAIHSASAFIAVIHRRNQLSVDPPRYRGSVWVEQEIAIAAFLVQSLGLTLPARVYVQEGVLREGVRGYIHLNPIEFKENDEVLADLESFWSQIK